MANSVVGRRANGRVGLSTPLVLDDHPARQFLLTGLKTPADYLQPEGVQAAERGQVRAANRFSPVAFGPDTATDAPNDQTTPLHRQMGKPGMLLPRQFEAAVYA